MTLCELYKIQISVPINNKVLLEPSCAYSLIACLWQFWCYKGGVEKNMTNILWTMVVKIEIVWRKYRHLAESISQGLYSSKHKNFLCSYKVITIDTDFCV